MFLKLYSFLLLLFINCDLVINDKCSICESNTNIACLTTNSFQFCKTVNGILIPWPELGTHVCKDGEICDSTNNNRCVVSGVPSCSDKCGKCNAETNIACLNKKNFTICYNNVIINNYGYPCPDSLVCYSGKKNFCVDPIMGSTCSGDLPAIPTDPKQFCTSRDDIVLPGRYGIKGECKKYNYCYKFQGNRTGIQLECLGRTNFNCKTHQCEIVCVNTC